MVPPDWAKMFVVTIPPIVPPVCVTLVVAFNTPIDPTVPEPEIVAVCVFTVPVRLPVPESS
ncbi:hypothetical protein [Phyllobacterium sp. 22229]|uniref:hypothetical protein n=1 Tax=Phyllobacterium sp. 22229 TaxID=3453895 RepID=UPI003F860B9C